MLIRLFARGSDLAEGLFDPVSEIPVLLLVILVHLGVRSDLVLDLSLRDVLGAVKACATLLDFRS